MPEQLPLMLAVVGLAGMLSTSCYESNCPEIEVGDSLHITLGSPESNDEAAAECRATYGLSSGMELELTVEGHAVDGRVCNGAKGPLSGAPELELVPFGENDLSADLVSASYRFDVRGRGDCSGRVRVASNRQTSDWDGADSSDASISFIFSPQTPSETCPNCRVNFLASITLK